MSIKILNKIKLVFVGDLKSINLEIIANSHMYLVQEKIKYILKYCKNRININLQHNNGILF